MKQYLSFSELGKSQLFDNCEDDKSEVYDNQSKFDFDFIRLIEESISNNFFTLELLPLSESTKIVDFKELLELFISKNGYKGLEPYIQKNKEQIKNKLYNLLKNNDRRF
jgi:hypothetical protein